MSLNPKELLQEINGDLQSASKVVYLEGKTDLPIFFALLGVQKPIDDIHEGILVKALGDKKGSGANSIRARVELAHSKKISGVFGITDGDGQSLEALSKNFNSPHPGPIFSWKAHCIENLLVKTGWPSNWSHPPNWQEELKRYAPYAAINQLVVEVIEILNALGLRSFTNPAPDKALVTAEEVLLRLQLSKDKLFGLDVAQTYQESIATIEGGLSDLNRAHTLIKGKWLLDHLAVTRTKKPANVVRSDWFQHAINVGGLPEVKDLWQRIRQESNHSSK